jgi:hypothetical protein
MNTGKILIMILCVSVLSFSTCTKQHQPLGTKTATSLEGTLDPGTGKIEIALIAGTGLDERYIIRPRCDLITYDLKCPPGNQTKKEKKSKSYQSIGIACPDPAYPYGTNDPHIDVIKAQEGAQYAITCSLPERYANAYDPGCNSLTVTFNTTSIEDPDGPESGFSPTDPGDYCLDNVGRVPLQPVNVFFTINFP